MQLRNYISTMRILIAKRSNSFHCRCLLDTGLVINFKQIDSFCKKKSALRFTSCHSCSFLQSPLKVSY